jgi:hypothetical protein
MITRFEIIGLNSSRVEATQIAGIVALAGIGWERVHRSRMEFVQRINGYLSNLSARCV